MWVLAFSDAVDAALVAGAASLLVGVFLAFGQLILRNRVGDVKLLVNSRLDRALKEIGALKGKLSTAVREIAALKETIQGLHRDLAEEQGRSAGLSEAVERRSGEDRRSDEGDPST